MAEVVLVIIFLIVGSVIQQIKKAQRKGQTEFKWPTPKSWQLPGPGQAPGQLGQVGQLGQPGGRPTLAQMMPGTPPQLVQPMPGSRPFQSQVVQPMQGYVPPPPPAQWVPPQTLGYAQQPGYPPPGYGGPGYAGPGYGQQVGYAQQPGPGRPGFIQPPVQPAFARPPGHRPPQHQLPAPKGELDDRVRELMNANNEVGAVRLLADEAELGIIEAQKYARSLVPSTPAGPATSTTPAASAASDTATPPDTSGTSGTSGTSAAIASTSAADRSGWDEERYTGSAAFGTSTFERDDENVWASGWTDTPEPDDRTDINELWDTVRTAARPPQPPPA